MKDTLYYKSGKQKMYLDTVRNKAVLNASISRMVSKQAKIEEYDRNPRYCANLKCNKPLPYDKRTNRFCSQSCSAISSNAKRDSSFSNLTYTKTVFCIRCDAPNNVDPRRSAHNFVCLTCKEGYPHSRVCCNTCKFCDGLFYSQKFCRICKRCQHLKWSNNKDSYSFKFNVFDYPDLFDIKMLQTIGWVSFGGKRGGEKNMSGLSRDHKVSVSDAKKYGYDPYYISHPCNCVLIPHTENNKKHTHSSITYEQLIIDVNEYDTKMKRPIP